MNVLVTGGNGFIGSHTVDLLVKMGYTVIVVDKKEGTDVRNPKAIYYVGDVTDSTFMDALFQTYRPRVVVHLAAQVDVQQSMKNPLKDVNVNLLGTVNILERCRRYDTKIIFASSAAVYGIPRRFPTDESHSTEPISVYGLSKLTAERYIQLFHQMYGLRFCILRYANVYGPRQDSTGEGGVVSIFTDMLVRHQTPVIYGSGEQTRDFVFVTDVARANVYAIERGENDIFNVCNKKEVTVNNLLKKISAMMNNDVIPIYESKKDGDIMRSVLDNTKIKERMGWEGTVGLERGLRETIDYFYQRYETKILSV